MTDGNGWQAVDLTNCDREPIHRLGAVQPFGFLIAVSGEWLVTHISANAGEWLGGASEELIGRPLNEIISRRATHDIRNKLQMLRSADSVERLFGAPLHEGGPLFDLAIHVTGGHIVIEAEPHFADESFNSTLAVRSMVANMHQASSFKSFAQKATMQMRALIGFDRVMIYRFDDAGSGEVIAETARAGLEPYLGLHYPASDIPKQARILYERNLLRIIADIDATPAPILPAAPGPDEMIDLSLSVLRSVSPIHIEYLKNIGVGASLSVSILRDGKLWGLFACHHMSPRLISLERRTAAELFGQMFSLLLESRERADAAQQEGRAREIYAGFMADISDRTAMFDDIAGFSERLSDILPCDGIAVSLDGHLRLHGATPTREEMLGLVQFLSQRASGQIFSSHELGAIYPAARDFIERAAGVLAIPVSRKARDYVLFFRKEAARTVTWAGNPQKAETLGPNGIRLTPRKSFEAWRETVRGQSLPWTPLERRVAESLRVSLLEVVLRLADIAEKERKTAQERQELLIAELNHRVRNILSLVRGLIAQSDQSGSVGDFIKVIGGRVQALARAHDQITNDNWQPAPLKTLIAAEAGAYLGVKAERVITAGEDVLLVPQAFSTLALVVHELMTNSAKYGALCDRSGHVEVAWAFDDMDRLILRWNEHGGPPVQAPSRRGFGTTIIERSVPYDLNGEADVTYDLMGLRARFAIPGLYVKRGGDKRAPAPAAEKPALPAGKERLAGTALIVEDNLIIALDAEDMLIQLGAEVRTANTVRQALQALDELTPSFALLDVNLGGAETSLPVARKLQELKVPFVFATGYGEAFSLPSDLKGAPVVRKPYYLETLQAVIAELRGHPVG
ncbi:MAG: HWE histidine kinase domain-containing protein [Alphaproteobacteria bacterium]